MYGRIARFQIAFGSARDVKSGNMRNQPNLTPGIGAERLAQPAPLLKPDFNFVAVRIANESVRESGRELSPRGHRASSAFDGRDRCVYILGPGQAKSKMNDSAGNAGFCRPLLEGQYVE